MFGPLYRVGWEDLFIDLRPFRESDMERVSRLFSSPLVQSNLATRGGFTINQEMEWFEKVSNSKTDVVWAIVPEGSDEVIGSTGIHGISTFDNSCHTGIAIFDRDWWGRGIASRAHLCRTLYAASTLNRYTIHSQVFVRNVASRRALERVGYRVFGVTPGLHFADSLIRNVYNLSWVNPAYASLVEREGLPQDFDTWMLEIENVLKHAKEVVEEL